MASKQIDFIAAGLVDSSGNPLQSGTVELYEAGTSTPVTGYADAALGSSLGSTITLDSRGAKLIFVDGLVDLKIIVKDSAGTTINTYDGLDYDASGPTVIDSDPEIVLQNTDQEDTDGGRQSIIRHKGEQSGGEVSTLATVTASHDGSSDDEKGKYEIKVNDGNDGNSPSIVALSLKSTLATFGTAVTTGGALTVPSGGATIASGNLTLSAGNIVVSGTVDGVDVATLNTNYTNHAADATIHFTESSISHLNITNIGTNTHAQIDTHIADSTLHFAEGSISHLNITNIGTNSHAQIDTHIADNTLHFTVASIDHGSITGLGDDDHTIYALASGARSFTGAVTIDVGNSGVTPSVDADDLFIENSGNSGITIGSGTTSTGNICFGNSVDNDEGKISYDHANDIMRFTAGANQVVSIHQTYLACSSGSSGVTLTSDADNLFIEDNGAAGLTIGSGTTSTGNIYFGDSVQSGAGRIVYDHTNDRMDFYANNAGKVRIDAGSLQPITDNVLELGDASFRWTEVFAVNGTINTSDSREKTIVAHNDTLLNVADAIDIVSFKWNDAIAEKGEANARIHYGVLAQDVKTALENEGLNPEAYSMFCYDEWDEVTDNEGNVTTEAGNRYGVRYVELLSLKMKAQRKLIQDLEARVATLESA